jgi:hypothetical protein
MIFSNDESSINEYAFMGKIDGKKDNFRNEVFKQFFLDRKKYPNNKYDLKKSQLRKYGKI